MNEENSLSKGEQKLLDIHALAVGGDGVARFGGQGEEQGGRVIFVERALPGQRVLAEITLVKKRFARARIVEVLAPTPHAATPQCAHFGKCGGCQWQDLDYAEQLRWKQLFVTESLERIGGLRGAKVAPTLGSPKLYGCRNKMEFAFAPGLNKSEWLRLGLYQRGSHQVVNVTECRLLSDRAMAVLAEVLAFCRACGVRAYDPEQRSGFWRHLVIREAAHDGSCVAHLISAPDPDKEPVVDELAKRLLDRFPHVACLAHSSRHSALTVAQGETLESVYTRDREDATVEEGAGCLLTERMAGLVLSLSPGAFFQPNTLAAERLYGVIRDMAARVAPPSGKLGLAWDAYCGVGGIALTLAPVCERVLGWDVDGGAVDDAEANAAANKIDNCFFMSGDAKEVLAAETDRPDLLVLDPPRSGMHPDMTALILKHAPRALISVSCDPATQARDLAKLAGAYDLDLAQPVDLFPHSPHVENAALMVRR